MSSIAGTQSIKIISFSKILVKVTSFDVIHAFIVNTLFIRCDAVPRRINTVYVDARLPSCHDFKCQELCRLGHSNIARTLVIH